MLASHILLLLSVLTYRTCGAYFVGRLHFARYPTKFCQSASDDTKYASGNEDDVLNAVDELPPISEALLKLLENHEDLNYGIIEEHATDRVLERTVKQITSSANIANINIDPTKKVTEICQTLKASKSGGKALDTCEVLKELFPISEEKDPFDERKMMTALRQMLNEDDFKTMFLNKNVGDIY